MKNYARLLAKSSNTPDSPRGLESLPGHTGNVLASAEALLDETGDAQLVAVGLLPETWRESFRRGVLTAAFCHDLGKANDQFQSMVRYQRDQKQALRHEALSLLIVEETSLRDWLAAAMEDALALNVLLWAAAGHHRKFPPAKPDQGTGVRLSLFLGHRDFHRTLVVGAKWLGLTEPPLLVDQDWLATNRTSVAD
jgi:CRISPR-associated endonuclease Cas3-HD